MSSEQRQDADRLYRNLHCSPFWNGVVNSEQANEIMRHGDFIMCNGHGRTIKCDQIAPNVFKIYTVRFK
jgi:hypothetical protein